MELSLASQFAMTKSLPLLRIWWIDDETDRLSLSAQKAIERPDHPRLRGKRAAKLVVIKVGERKRVAEVLTELDEACRRSEAPHLIVIDQMLNLPNDDGVVQRGSGFAAAMRDKHPTIPLVGVTGASASEIAALQKEQFIEFFERDSLQSGDRIPDLYGIADGFAGVLKARPKGKTSAVTNLLKLLDCPTEDRALLVECLPGPFKAPWDEGTPHAFARWVWHNLTGRAGFLYDDLEGATLVGLKREGFQLLSARLKECEYLGAFSSASRLRWWVSKVRQKVRELTRAESTEPLNSLGRKLIGDKKELFSKCYGNAEAEAVPDVVAFADGTQRKRVQTRVGDTKPLETDTAPLGFEQRRVFFGR